MKLPPAPTCPFTGNPCVATCTLFHRGCLVRKALKSLVAPHLMEDPPHLMKEPEVRSLGHSLCLCCGVHPHRSFGFCDKCWYSIRSAVEEAHKKYRDGLDDGPHDAMEEEAIFDSFVSDLWEGLVMKIARLQK